MTEKQRQAWEALRRWMIDTGVTSTAVDAIDALLDDDPHGPVTDEELDAARVDIRARRCRCIADKQPVNPPPDDLPVWYWEKPDERGMCVARYEQLGPYHHWWPVFVPLDAEPGSVWVLWDDGNVTHSNMGLDLSEGTLDPSRHTFVVPKEEANHE